MRPMADERRDAPEAPSGSGRRRLAATIALTATELPANPPASAGVAPGAEQSTAASASEATDAPAESRADGSAATEQTPDTMQGDVPSPSEPDAPQAKPAGPGPEPEPAQAPSAWRRGGLSADHVKGGLIG